MGKGYNNYMCKKPFHPGSKANIKRAWMAEQKTENEKKKQEELKVQYEKEQDLYNNRALISTEGKDKLELNFMYEAPPGAKRERQKEDDEPEYKFEWQRKYNAPREDYAKGNADIKDQPFGIPVRNVRCIKCHKWGHINTDKECPLYSQASTSSMPTTSMDPIELMRQMKEDGFGLKENVLGHHLNPKAANQQLIPSDESDPEMEFLKSLSTAEKKKLLRKLKKLSKKQEKAVHSKKKKSKKSKKSKSKESSDSDCDAKKKRKKSKESDTDTSSDESSSREKKKKSITHQISSSKIKKQTKTKTSSESESEDKYTSKNKKHSKHMRYEQNRDKNTKGTMQKQNVSQLVTKNLENTKQMNDRTVSVHKGDSDVKQPVKKVSEKSKVIETYKSTEGERKSKHSKIFFASNNSADERSRNSGSPEKASKHLGSREKRLKHSTSPEKRSKYSISPDKELKHSESHEKKLKHSKMDENFSEIQKESEIHAKSVKNYNSDIEEMTSGHKGGNVKRKLNTDFSENCDAKKQKSETSDAEISNKELKLDVKLEHPDGFSHLCPQAKIDANYLIAEAEYKGKVHDKFRHVHRDRRSPSVKQKYNK